MKYLRGITGWPSKKGRQEETADDVMSQAQQEVETNAGITLVVHKFGGEFRGRVIYIPLPGGGSVVIKRIGKKCRAKKGALEFDIDPNQFTDLWSRCVEKKYKYIIR